MTESEKLEPLPGQRPDRAQIWRLRSRTLDLPRRPLVMGIVNVTPDSFSDGGQFLDADAAVAHALQLAADGADLLDIGGESTRPYSEPVSADEELQRVLPVIERLIAPGADSHFHRYEQGIGRPAAIDAGAEIINDVTGLAGDPEMVQVAVDTSAAVCVMHMQGTPQTMQDNPTYADVVAEVREYLRQRRDALVAAGIERERICLDPGIGFGKTHEHNIALDGELSRAAFAWMPIIGGPFAEGFFGQAHRRQRGRTAPARRWARRSAWQCKACKLSAFTTCDRSAKRSPLSRQREGLTRNNKALPQQANIDPSADLDDT